MLVEDTDLSHNSAQAGGGAYTNSAVTFSRTQIVGNSAQTGAPFFATDSGNGGGVFSFEAATTFADCLIDQNSAEHIGGGVINTSLSILRSITMSRTTVSNNHAENGGGISSQFFSITDSTFNGNSATGSGGGILGYGTINQSTISGNTAAVGAGLRLAGPTTINHSTIAFNEATSAGAGIFHASNNLHLNHTIVARNTAQFPATSGDISALIGTTISARYSIVGNNSGSGLALAPIGSPDANGNLIGGGTALINPLLAPLAENCGLTMTHALLSNSPALNAGDPMATAGQNGVPVYDQRGLPFNRIAGGRIDIGAFESQVPTGDFNNDTNTDAADYVMWRKVAGHESAYNIWTTQFGESTTGGSISQPSPSGRGQGEGALESASSLIAAGFVTPNVEPSLVPNSPKAEAFELLGVATAGDCPNFAESAEQDGTVPLARHVAPLRPNRVDSQLIDFVASRYANERSTAIDGNDFPSDDVTDEVAERNEALDTAFDVSDFTNP
jgi:predicted outer membrane repeat protein